MWVISDGTTISDTAEVSGSSEFAEEMRAQLEARELGVPVLVFVDAPPCGMSDLDTSDLASIDAWVSMEAIRADLTITYCSLPDAPPSQSTGFDLIVY